MDEVSDALGKGSSRLYSRITGRRKYGVMWAWLLTRGLNLVASEIFIIVT